MGEKRAELVRLSATAESYRSKISSRIADHYTTANVLCRPEPSSEYVTSQRRLL